VEVTASADGQVFVSVADRRGNLLHPSTVQLSPVMIVTPAGRQRVSLQPRGGYFYGVLDGPPPPLFSVGFDVGVGGHWYRRVRTRRLRPLAPGFTVEAIHARRPRVVRPRPRRRRRHGAGGRRGSRGRAAVPRSGVVPARVAAPRRSERRSTRSGPGRRLGSRRP
jgi:hypothetical protein